MNTKWIFSLFFTLLLGACASAPDYRAADGRGYGYKESKLGEQQYRVHFKARGTDKGKAMDYVMLRAAELTLLNGYDWFVVTHRETIIDREKVSTGSELGMGVGRERVTHCGVLGCRTRSYPSHEISAGIQLGGPSSSDIESILEIRLGKGVRPENQTSYDAREVRQNLQPQDAQS